jgi:hypothetical protein
MLIMETIISLCPIYHNFGKNFYSNHKQIRRKGVPLSQTLLPFKITNQSTIKANKKKTRRGYTFLNSESKFHREAKTI